MARPATHGHKRLFALIALLPFWLSFASLAASPLPNSHLVNGIAPRPQDPSRKSLAWGPEHNHKVFADLESANDAAPLRRGLDSTRKHAYAAAIHYVNAEVGPKTPYSVATRLAKHLLGYAQGLAPSGHDFYVRPDSYTDPSSGISHYFIRQLVNGLEVADGDLNINISPEGKILSFGSTLFAGQAPPPFTNQGVAASEATSDEELSQRCDKLRSELEAHLFPQASSAEYTETAGADWSNTNEAFVRGGVHQFVFESNAAAAEHPAHRAKVDSNTVLPLQEELHELCGVPTDDPLLHGADLSSRLAGSLSHLRAKRDLHGPESIVDPRLALIYFLRQATPDEGLAARLSDPRAAESEAAQIVTTFEHKLQPHAGKTDSGAQASHTQIEYLHNVPTAKGPVPAQLAYVQTEGEGLNLVWKFQIPLEDNAYEAYADAHRPGSISTVVDWVHSMPRPRSKAATKPAKVASLGRPEFGNRRLPELGRPDFSSYTPIKPSEADGPAAPLSHEPLYRVFKWGLNDPTEGRRSNEKGERYEEASPVGWHTVPGKHSPFSSLKVDEARSLVGDNTVYSDTRGNNVFAQADPSGNGEWKSDSIKRPKGRLSEDGSTDMMFNYPYKWRKSEKKQTELPPADYVAAATVQLFVTINEYHDLLYAYGFDEASGNFQEHNFGRGGEANDGVIAFAQDGAGTDNADFMTPPDGQRGRMRMYVWDQSTPFRDGDFEAGIVIHEYSHGLSTRLTGGPANSGCLGWGESGGMGEGWGDALASIIRRTGAAPHDWPMGSWASNRAKGIRNYPYSTNKTVNPETYSYLDHAGYWGVHAIGEVWATMLNEVEEALVLEHGFTTNLFPPATNATAKEQAAFFLTEDEVASLSKHRVSKRRVPRHGNSLLVQLILDGMKLQPCRPSFFDARDAIVQADKHLTGGQNKCLLWKAFAKRGLGTDASVIGRTPWGGGKRSDGYAVPHDCKSSSD
ncbi:related to extracellular elastinolytic metalloproteinase precursor [Ustilago trichophora]|uniref:Extracellular metalloproteinase n=1 Tax=Ustilago trichophora TaxID=86804 RepID=A0A5C3ENB6_9BASI|nr:related to extracellular elastinolytic metalloproteinase precursor [Ustilago trichophora]